MPSNLTISAADTFVELLWDLVNGAEGYRLEWLSDPTENDLTTNGTTTSHVSLVPNRRYFYTVPVDNQTVVLSAVLASADATAPATVSITSGVEQNTLSWSPVSGTTAYRVYWSYEANVSPATGTRIDVDGSQTSFIHTDLDADTHYYYVVAALLSNNTQGVASAEVGARAQGAQAAAVTATASDSRVDLSWAGALSAPVTVSTSQTLELPSPPFSSDQLGNPVPITIFGLVNGTRHAFRVRPVFAEGAGPESTTVFATPNTLTTGAPTQVTLTAGRGVNTLSWETVSGTMSYQVTWTPADPSGETERTVTEPRFRHSGLELCSDLTASCPTYSYTVQVSGSSAVAPTVEAVSVDLRPVPPLIVNTPSVILAGVKPSGTRIDITDANGLVETVDLDRETSWTATVDLPTDGLFVFRLVAFDESTLASIETTYQVTRDTSAPGNPTAVTAVCESATTASRTFTLSGDKDAGTAVFRKLEPDAADQQIVGATFDLTWSGVIEVENSTPLIDSIYVVAKDAAGNASGTVELTPLPACP